MLGRSWCEINLEQLKTNYLICKDKIQGEITAVVKADAYGHGAVAVSKALQSVGCNSFAVATLEEGIQHRHGGIKGPISILGYTPVTMLKCLKNNDLCQVVFSKEYADALIEENEYLNVQMAIDTGMNRIGFRWENQDEIIQTYEKLTKTCWVKGVFTHLACADDKNADNFTDLQIHRFLEVVNKLDGLVNCHFSNSAYFLNNKEGDKSNARLGICLYGLGENLLEGMKPVLKWKSVVVMVKRLQAGEGVGYGQTFVAKKDMVVATVATGYADGFSYSLSNLGKVEIRNQFARVIGRVCMDMLMIDVSHIDTVSVGDEVILLGEKYGANEMSVDLKTIPYEIVCNISKRVFRVYK